MKLLNILKILAGRSWGLHPNHLRRLYIALIRNRMDYGSFLFDSAAKSHLLKLDKVQNAALRIIGGFIKSTPIHVMECETCIPPLQIRRQYLAVKCCLKAMSWSNNNTVSLIKELSLLCQGNHWHRKRKPLLPTVYHNMRDLKVYSSSTLKIFGMDIWMSHINIDFISLDLEDVTGAKSANNNNTLKYNTLHMLNTRYEGWHKIFTDGSKTKGGIGAGFYDPCCNIKEGFQITSEITVMGAELLAIAEAISYAESKGLQYTVILSDSKSALQHIARCASEKRGAPIAYDILRKVLKLISNGLHLRLQWVPAHVGLSGNEEADTVAKQAVLSGTEIYVIPDYSEALLKYKYDIFTQWKNNFMSNPKGIWYKTIQNSPPQMPWFLNSKLRREELVLAHRLRSGHVPLNNFKYLMKKAISPNCSVCGTLEDVHHLLSECARTEVVRNKLKQKFNINIRDVGVYQSILSNPLSATAKTMFSLMIKLFKESV